jgi:hypothetical protein
MRGIELRFKDYAHLADGKARFHVASALFKVLDDHGGQILLSKVGSLFPDEAVEGLRTLQTRLLSFVQEAPHGKYLSIEGAGGGQVLALKLGPTNSAISLEALRQEIIHLLKQDEAPRLVRSVGSCLSHGARLALKVNRIRLSKFLHLDNTFIIRNSRVTLATQGPKDAANVHGARNGAHPAGGEQRELDFGRIREDVRPDLYLPEKFHDQDHYPEVLGIRTRYAGDQSIATEERYWEGHQERNPWGEHWAYQGRQEGFPTGLHDRDRPIDLPMPQQANYMYRGDENISEPRPFAKNVYSGIEPSFRDFAQFDPFRERVMI